MTIWADTTEEEVDTSHSLNFSFVGSTLRLEVRGIAIEDMHVLLLDIYMAEEVRPHEAMIALWVILWDTYVLVHVEGNDVLERDTPCLVSLH